MISNRRDIVISRIHKFIEFLITPYNEETLTSEDKRKARLISSVLISLNLIYVVIVINDILYFFYEPTNQLTHFYFIFDIIGLVFIFVIYIISRTKNFRISSISIILLIETHAVIVFFIEENYSDKIFLICLVITVIIILTKMLFTPRTLVYISIINISCFFMIPMIDARVQVLSIILLTAFLIVIFVFMMHSSYYNQAHLSELVMTIDERDKASVELRNQKKELSTFAKEMSHDLGNCLMVIDGYLQVLARSIDEDKKENVEFIITQVRYMDTLLKRSLILADAGLAIERTTKVDLNQLVKDIANLTIPKEKEIVFSHGKLPNIECDREKIKQVFRNIFENAIIHGKAKKIEVSFANNKLLIENDGDMIPKEIQVALLEREFMAREKGYGLIIVKKIIEAHGWKIRIQSTKEKTSMIIELNSDK